MQMAPVTRRVPGLHVPWRCVRNHLITRRKPFLNSVNIENSNSYLVRHPTSSKVAIYDQQRRMGAVKSVGPNEAIVLSGTFSKQSFTKIISGGWLWKNVASNFMKVPLSLFTVYPKCEDAETSEGVQLYVSGAAHVKVLRELVRIAAEQWGGKNHEQVRAAMEATIEGHLRSILSTMTVEEAYKDRLKFAEAVREEAETDLAQMGFTIMSFVILDLKDDVGYFSSLGKKAIADVKRDAAIAVAEANAVASVREFECHTATQDAELRNEEKIEENRKNFEVASYGYQREMRSAKADVDFAYSLSATKLMSEIMKCNKEIEVIERRKKAEIESIGVEIKALELQINQKLPADAEKYKIETIGEARKNANILLDRGVREGKKIVGIAKAIERMMVGNARIERQRLRAEVFKKHGVTAVVSQVLEALPKIAATISRPLSTIEEITMIDEDILTAMAVAHETLNSGLEEAV